MQPSSLIFLVIIGIWAAYFVQYWVRRREHLATIRSVDAFSETMRVLQLRAPLPSVDGGSQAPRTYAVSPARAMRPQVTVKRAEASTMLREDVSPTSASAPTAPMPERRRPISTREVEPEVATMRPSRATRGIVLVVGLLGTVVFGLLAALGVLVVWSPLVPLAMAAAGFAWLRAGVRAEIEARHDARREAQRMARRSTSSRRTVDAVAAPMARTVVSEPVMTHELDAESEVDTESEITQPGVAERSSSAVPFDVSAQAETVEAAAAQAAVEAQPVVERPAAQQPVAERAVEHEVALPEVDEDDIPLTWDPRPVPRPTYTMKAKAPERPAMAPQAEVEREDEHTAYDDVPQRRISGL
ncbi:hypothetical protein [Knoellia sp. LjRoot47]|uniref:hypothetical protein n=1 Tax=Knoellia sp. LjRoot47 TaxID=3342330 RepID=UPI003ED0651A